MYDRFPGVRYHRDGRTMTVNSQEELDALEPGWADSPVGPWDDGFEGDPPWEPGKGPYAPYNDWQQYAPVLVDGRPVFGLGGPPWSLPGLVYATGPLIYDGWARSRGELFTLGGHLDDDDLLTTGKAKYVPPYGQFAWHAQTYRGFLDKAILGAYARRYEVGDVTEFVAVSQNAQAEAARSWRETPDHAPGSVSAARDLKAHPAPRLRRKRQSSYNELTFVTAYTRVYWELCDAQGGHSPSQSDIAANLPLTLSVRQLYTLRKKYSLLAPPPRPHP
jgi:hypothetical protein